ncbi:glycosyltransferase family 4 protein [Geomonas oryzisoli]|uniref:Glycosyltransferase family 4 protein n=1 Tax=Geomonas oryzisoli TaxID=2847992 RepID=A0ABX8J565_9BACT|nr:glycosyltransferase family 4 protein [Geomonas oryzisoli]QWV91842.1 glycosyltransferase family 4 protein [Geomonas oryzisoli]
MKRNILYLIESSETGGAENIFAQLVNGVDRRRYTPHVALLYPGPLYDRLVADGWSPVLVDTRPGALDCRLLLGIFRLVRRLDIQLVHSHLFTTNVYASALRSLTGVPVISTFHGVVDVSPDDRCSRLKWLVINGFSSSVVFVSEGLQREFVRAGLASSRKSVVIYNGVDFSRFQTLPPKGEARGRLGIGDGAYVILCVGDLRPAKGYRDALEATAVIRATVPEALLVIAGTKTELYPELLALCDELKIRECVRFLGYRDDVADLFAASDVYLSCSLSEGFSLTVVEAMAAGVPVVATRSGGPEEIVVDGTTGLLVDVAEPAQMAGAILSYRNDPAHGRRVAAAAQRDAGERFTLQGMIHSYQELYDSILGAA